MLARDREVVRISGPPDADSMLFGYARGEFVMPYLGSVVYQWYSPFERGVLDLDALRVSRSLRKSAARLDITFDEAFAAVLHQCADPDRPGAWITGTLMRCYLELHERGYAHSVEVWDGDLLAGGLFVVNIGGLVCGESMFHSVRDASKVALVGLVHRLREDPGPVLLETQWMTDHLATLGVRPMPREEYLRRLPRVINRQPAL